jgi:hypothetical protein
MEEVRSFWLSFVGDAGSLGACIVDVSATEAAQDLAVIDRLFPNHLPGAEWVAAATAKAHRLGCNPGGEVASWSLPQDHPKFADLPRNVLLSRAEWQARGAV